jgi:hypothetical protein
MDDDSLFELTKFFTLWKNKWLINLALTSKSFYTLIQQFLIRDAKSMIRYLGSHCLEFIKQGTLYLSEANFMALLKVRKCLKRCYKHEREIRRSLKTLKSSAQSRLFERLMKLMSNDLLHTHYNDSVFDIVTRSLDFDEYLRKEEFVFDEIDKFESEIKNTGEIHQIYDLAPYLMCKDDPLKKIQQLLSLDVVKQISNRFNICSGTMLIMLCKNLTPEQTQLSIQSITSNPHFKKMFNSNQKDMLFRFLGKVCLHEGIDDKVLIKQVSRTSTKARFLTSFYEKDHVIKRFQIAASLNLDLDFSSLVDFLDLSDDQLDAAMKTNLLQSFQTIYQTLWQIKYMKPKLIINYKHQTSNALMNDHYYPLFQNFLNSNQLEAFIKIFTEFQKDINVYVQDHNLFARVFDKTPEEIAKIDLKKFVSFID